MPSHDEYWNFSPTESGEARKTPAPPKAERSACSTSAVFPTPPSPWMKITSRPPPLCASSRIFFISPSRPQKNSPGDFAASEGLPIVKRKLFARSLGSMPRSRAAFRGMCCRRRRPSTARPRRGKFPSARGRNPPRRARRKAAPRATPPPRPCRARRSRP